jgi:hypothetical protein
MNFRDVWVDQVAILVHLGRCLAGLARLLEGKLLPPLLARFTLHIARAARRPQSYGSHIPHAAA